MTVYRRNDRGGAWWYEFMVNRRRFRRPCLDAETSEPVRTKTAAEAAETQAKAEVLARYQAAKRNLRPDSYTWGQAIALHMKRVLDKSPEHVDNAVLYTSEIGRFFGPATPFAELSDDRIEEYREFAAAQTLRVWLGGARKKKPGDLANTALWRDTGRRRSPRQINNYLKCLSALIAIAERVRDPVTKLPVLDQHFEVKLHKVPKRKPRPIGDQELHQRLAVAPPWTRDAGELSRLFGLRLSEALEVEERHCNDEHRALLFGAGETKSGNDEFAYGGEAGWQLLTRLRKQARARGQVRLVTWPGPKYWRAHLRGEAVPREEWRPVRTLKRSWRTTIRTAEIEQPHRYHDIRARYVTEVAKKNKAAAKDAARHQDPSTTELYIQLANEEIRAAVAEASASRPRPLKRPKLRVVR